MAEETLSYSRRNVQDAFMYGRFESHTFVIDLHSRMPLSTTPSEMNFVNFAGRAL